jgi:gliding motility-associated lipoprotein GldD
MNIKRYCDSLLIVIVGVSFITASCNSVYTSKKKGYFHIELPPHAYTVFDQPGFPYSFEYPIYAVPVKDSTYFDSTPENDYWINIDFPQFNARIFLSYKIIGGQAVYKIKQADGTYRDSIGINRFDAMVNDAFNLTNKNQVASTSIKDSVFTTKNNITGIYFKVGGNAATGRQFFISDTSRHFLRGALYFGATPNADSIRPVQNFLEEDIRHMINSFRWRN